MQGVNKVILIGNLGADPEMKYLEKGSVLARFELATSESYTKNEGNNQKPVVITHTEWHKIELWDNLAIIAEKYLKKGDMVYIEGKIRSEAWQDKEGKSRITHRIRASNLTLLGNKKENSNEIEKQIIEAPISIIQSKTTTLPVSMIGDPNDDLPF